MGQPSRWRGHSYARHLRTDHTHTLHQGQITALITQRSPSLPEGHPFQSPEDTRIYGAQAPRKEWPGMCVNLPPPPHQLSHGLQIISRSLTIPVAM